MAINQNHIAEELDGVKCSVVEKNVTPERAEFLKKLLEHNRYTVVIAATPAAKPAPAKPASKPAPAPAVPEGEAPAVPASPAIPAVPVVESAPPPPPSTFSVGVTDLMFNPTNAIYGRALRTQDGHVVTMAYWQQKEDVSRDEVPYYSSR